MPPAGENIDEFFANEWARSVFTLSLEELKRECQEKGRTKHFALFEFYDVEEGGAESTYAEVATRFGLKPTDVTNYLSLARREFRRIVLDQLRQMTASEEEFRMEARTLLGVDI